jgi:hypothetical protein
VRCFVPTQCVLGTSVLNFVCVAQVGNFTDLIKMRKGIKSYEEAWKVDWWTDPDMISSSVFQPNSPSNSTPDLSRRQTDSKNSSLRFLPERTLSTASATPKTPLFWLGRLGTK